MASGFAETVPVLVTLPCDLTQWPVIKGILLDTAQSIDTDELLANLEKAHGLIQRGDYHVDPKAKKMKKSKNTFNGLKNYLDNHISEIDRNVFFNVVLPCLVHRAVAIEQLKPEDGLFFIRQNEAKEVTYSRKLVASIVACGFLCLFPGRAYSKHSSLCGINYDDFFHHLSNQSQKAKLTCVLQYFEQLAGDPEGPQGNMTFAREVIGDENIYGMKEWMECDYPLCRVDVYYPPGKIEDAGHTAIQVDFANKKLGGGVLAKGAVQEEIRFCTCPELQASMLFMEEMLDNEAIVIQGFENYSKYKGYSRSLQYDGIYEDAALRNANGDLENTLCAIDACPSRRIGGAKEQYKVINVLRELNKSFAGFSLSQQMFELVTNNSRSDTELMPIAMTAKESSTASKSAQNEGIKESQLSVLTNFTSNLAQSIMQEVLVKSDTKTPMQNNRVNSIDAPNDTREESGENRPIPSCEERRRSSNMSNLSSSTSGKRSSSEFSSEFEEYFEAFQQRELALKHIIIQEEACGSSDQDSGVRMFGEQPKTVLTNVTRPSVIRPHPDPLMEQNTGNPIHCQEENSFQIYLKDSSHVGESTDEQTMAGELGGSQYSNEDDGCISKYACETSNDIVEQAVGDAVRKVVGFMESDAVSDICRDLNVDNHSTDEDIPSPTGKITASLYVAISRMAENMVNEGFKVVKDTIISEQEQQAPEENKESISPALLTKIEGLADRLVSYAMKSAVTISTCHLATRRRASRAKWGGHGGISQEMYLFADNFVQEVMHEALCIAREEMNVPLPDRTQEAWLKPPERERANSIYFQAEFSTGFRGSNPNLPVRRRDSVGSFRRGSYDERLGRRRASSSGFRDSLLSDFEDELIRSNVSSPGIQMLLGLEQASNEKNSQRRASEPANHTGPCQEFSGTKYFLSSPLKKRACSMDCSSSRQVVLDWLSRQSSSSNCNLQQNTRSKARTRTTSSHLDWFAQDLLVDAFNDAFVELFGGSYYTTQASSLSSAVSSQTELDRCRGNQAPSMPVLSKYASNLAKSVVDEACLSAAQVIESVGDKRNIKDAEHYPELEAAADQLARKVMREALEIAKSEWTIYCRSNKSNHQRPIATGNWGCGAYKGDPQLKAMIQWASASRVFTPSMWYYTFGNDEVKQLPKLTRKVLNKNLTVGALLTLVNQYCQKRCSKKVQGSLFDFLFEKLENIP